MDYMDRLHDCPECGKVRWAGSIHKCKTTISVLQDWVLKLPLREQGTLLTGVRGCDLSPKILDCINEKYGCSTGEGSNERQLVAFLRYCFMNPADAREVDMPGAFFKSIPPKDWKPSQFGHYPLHWYSHIMHCFEVVGYRHSDISIRTIAISIYKRMATSLHLNVETKYEMIARLSEDRIFNGNVVS